MLRPDPPIRKFIKGGMKCKKIGIGIGIGIEEVK